MPYTEKEVLDYIVEEDVKFVRLIFCDAFGVPKNISVFAGEMEDAFQKGAVIDASALRGFECAGTELVLRPEPETLAVLPWRPHHGRVVRMYCAIERPDGSVFEGDGRRILREAEARASEAGVECRFSFDEDFYLFKLDEQGNATREPLDHAGYMDMSPEDKGENVRREICLTLEEMGIAPVASQHMGGPGQNRVYCRPNPPLEAADGCVAFKTVVKTVAASNGLYADFSPKPQADCAGNSARINIFPKLPEEYVRIETFAAGIRDRAGEMAAYLKGVPEVICTQRSGVERIEIVLRDSAVNPYIAYALLLTAGMERVRGRMEDRFIEACLPESVRACYAGALK